MDWHEIVEDVGPRLFRYFCARFSHEQADDLTQETLIRLVRKVEDNLFRPDRGNLRMLAFGIAHYVALEQRRQAGYMEMRTDQLDDTHASEADSTEMLMVHDQRIQLLRNKITLLSEREQQILSLLVDRDLDLLSIARILQVPEGTVKSHIHRAKAKLLKFLSEEDA